MDVHKSVQNYYGKVLNNSSDLKTSACCIADAMPKHLRSILSEISDEVKDKFYGCGSPLPFVLEGQTVLDLGCGTGRDCFMAAKLVGPKGRVIGVDMTPEQLEVANRNVNYHTDRFGYKTPNVEFHCGQIEDLKSIDIASESVDIVISNCVINLSPNKEDVFKEIFRVLKPGGELYFSDVFTDRRLKKELTTDPVLVGECLGGAQYFEDFRRLMNGVDNFDFRYMSNTLMTLNNEEISKKCGNVKFYSSTVRAFKLDLEDRSEDFGQTATYLGTIRDSEDSFRLDDHHLFEKNKTVPVCGNTAKMLASSRYGKHFKIIGDESEHFGIFDCKDDGLQVETNSDQTCC